MGDIVHCATGLYSIMNTVICCVLLNAVKNAIIIE